MKKYDHKRNREMDDFRNYDQEARQLITNLGKGQKYELLEQVVRLQQQSCSDTRRKELVAVQNAIVRDKSLDHFRMKKIVQGHITEMAKDARMRDGNTKPYRKKV